MGKVFGEGGNWNGPRKLSKSSDLSTLRLPSWTQSRFSQNHVNRGQCPCLCYLRWNHLSPLSFTFSESRPLGGRLTGTALLCGGCIILCVFVPDTNSSTLLLLCLPVFKTEEIFSRICHSREYIQRIRCDNFCSLSCLFHHVSSMNPLQNSSSLPWWLKW